ncbi:adenylylsulfate kinase [Cellulomonas sp. URHB0016]
MTTIWLTGLSGAGKTTLAHQLVLRLGHRPVEHLDGDALRSWFTDDLGFSRAHRSLNVRRIGRLAHLLGRNGVVCVVSVISPYAEDREWVRDLHEQEGVAFREVHVATPLAVCEARDPKGLYAAARRGDLPLLTGVNDPYEAPAAPFHRTEDGLSAAENARALLEELRLGGLDLDGDRGIALPSS